MAIAISFKQYLHDHAIPYDVVTHEATGSAGHAAETAHVSGDKMAKAVVLRGSDGYLMAVLPASHHLEMDLVRQKTGQDLRLASEAELLDLFPDCERGAVPACGAAYGLHAVVDDVIDIMPDVYVEGGDHRSLVHVEADAFRRMLGNADHGRISIHD